MRTSIFSIFVAMTLVAMMTVPVAFAGGEDEICKDPISIVFEKEMDIDLCSGGRWRLEFQAVIPNTNGLQVTTIFDPYQLASWEVRVVPILGRPELKKWLAARVNGFVRKIYPKHRNHGSDDITGYVNPPTDSLGWNARGEFIEVTIGSGQKLPCRFLQPKLTRGDSVNGSKVGSLLLCGLQSDQHYVFIAVFSNSGSPEMGELTAALGQLTANYIAPVVVPKPTAKSGDRVATQDEQEERPDG